MKTLRLNEESEIGKKIHEIERIMDDADLVIRGTNLVLVVKGQEYNIGKDSDQFPRFVDEPFWRYKE